MLKKINPVMFITKTTRKVFTTTNFTFAGFFRVFFSVFRLVGYKSEIRRSIIVSNTINVMNHLFVGKVSVKLPFHNESMFSDITKGIGIGVVWFKNKLIAISYKITTLKIVSQLTTFISRTLKTKTCASSSRIKLANFNQSSLPTPLTKYFLFHNLTISTRDNMLP